MALNRDIDNLRSLRDDSSRVVILGAGRDGAARFNVQAKYIN